MSVVCHAQTPPANSADSKGSPAATAPEGAASELAKSEAMLKVPKCARPIYPTRAMRDGHQGNGVLKIKINADGGLGSAIVEKSTGSPKLDQAKLESVMSCKFK
jgi:TonB family protein